MDDWANSREVTRCRMCQHSTLELVLDLGTQYLSEFRNDLRKPPRHPLILKRCPKCGLAQLSHTVPPEQLYHDSYSFRSGISDAIRINLMQVVTHGAMVHAAVSEPHAGKMRWLDIASNDGTLLEMVPPDLFQRFGVDPLQHLCEIAAEHADQIVVGLFDSEMFADAPPFDVITSISMFYDLDDPCEFVRGVKSILAPDGVWVVQQNYLPSMLANTSFDNISHEHLTYWDLCTFDMMLNREGLKIIDVAFDPINGGCIRTVIGHNEGPFEQAPSVKQAWLHEIEFYGAVHRGTDDWPRFEQFAQEAHWAINQVANFVSAATGAGQQVWVYGASTRGAVIWQAANLDVTTLRYVVERNPEKVGRIMSSIGVPIVSEEFMRVQGPDYLLVGPWWLRGDFVKREAQYLARGGQMVFPLPRLEVVGSGS